MLTVATMMIMRVYYKGGLYNLFIPSVENREKAKRLALSGIQVAIAQLALHDSKIVPEKEVPDQKKKTPEADQRRKDLLTTLLFVQNRWQKFKLEEKEDGVDGEMAIYITCEDGKIPLNALIDYSKRSFYKTKRFEGERFFKDVFQAMKPYTKEQDLFEPFRSLIKKMKYQITDVAQLLEIQLFKVMRNELYLVPSLPNPDESYQEEQSEKPKIYLADLFTVWNTQPKMYPLLFSPSIRLLFGMGYPSEKTQMSLEAVKETMDKFPFSKVDWEKDWEKYAKPFYKKDYKSISKDLQALLSSKFEPRVFSVLCYGKVGRVKQKLIAIIDRSFTNEGEVFSVKRIYWI